MAYSLVDRGLTRKHRRVIRVSPLLDISGAMTQHNVLFNSTEIPGAVSNEGGCSILRGLSILNLADTEQDIDLVFTQKKVHPGTDVNQVVSWTDSQAQSAKILGHVHISWANNDTDFVLQQLFTLNGESLKNTQELFLQAESGSTSVYCFGVDRSGGTTYSQALDFAFHIEY